MLHSSPVRIDRWLGFPSGEKFWSRGKRTGARVRRGALYGARRVPRHHAGRGEAASAEEKRGTASCCLPREEEDEDDPSFVLLTKRYVGR
jgi:hypothetical protein